MTLKGFSMDDIGEWRDEQEDVCWICRHRPFPGCNELFDLQVHHVERRSHASRDRYNVRCNYFLACKDCHDGKLATMPHAKQLAYKFKRDPENFDLEGWLRIRDPELKAPYRVTMEDIQSAGI